APANEPARLYQAKARVRAGPLAVCASAACSVGRKRLTSPADGFKVPAAATIINGQNDVRPANPRPVAAMSAVAPSRMRFREGRCPGGPAPGGTGAGPSKGAVANGLARKGAEARPGR